MARFYVEHNGEWNIFSTVVDDFILDEFVCLDALKARLLYERYKELTEDIDSLMTDRPRVNVMSYTEATERMRKTEPQTSKGGCTNCADRKTCEDAFTEVSQYCGAYEPKDDPLTCRNKDHYADCEYKHNCNPVVCFKALDEFREMVTEQKERSE